MSRLAHFKMSFDPALDYPAIAQELYGTNKALVCAEKMDVNAHVHFQGYTDYADTTFRDRTTAATASHYMRKDITKRPVRHVKRKLDETGFQYMCKEALPTILYKHQFTDADITEMHEASNEHVQELKEGLRNHLVELDSIKRLVPIEPGKCFKRAIVEAMLYYQAKGTMPPPNVRKLTIWALFPLRTDEDWQYHFANMM